MSKNSDNDFIGVITDGKYKLDIRLFKKCTEVIEIERGQKLEITGDLIENSKYRICKIYFIIIFQLFYNHFLIIDDSYILNVDELSQIKIIKEESLDFEELMKGTEIILNKKLK